MAVLICPQIHFYVSTFILPIITHYSQGILCQVVLRENQQGWSVPILWLGKKTCIQITVTTMMTSV